MKKTTNKYSDQDLKEFQTLIENKLNKAKAQLLSLEEQLDDLNENEGNTYDPDDNSNSFVDREFLQEMAHRQSKHIRDLENAMLRIKNKTFGICEVTGELIDKKRLLAVPTTSKSLAAKLFVAKPEKLERPKSTTPAGEKVILTKIYKKSNGPVPPPKEDDDDLDTPFEEGLDFEDNDDDWVNTSFDDNIDDLP